MGRTTALQVFLPSWRNCSWNLVKDKKQVQKQQRGKAIQLDNELRTKEIGDMTIQKNSQSLIADLLQNVEASVSDKKLFMYMLNDLNEKYDLIINVIKHQKPFPSFDEANNMLDLEETSLKR